METTWKLLGNCLETAWELLGNYCRPPPLPRLVGGWHLDGEGQCHPLLADLVAAYVAQKRRLEGFLRKTVVLSPTTGLARGGGGLVRDRGDQLSTWKLGA